MRRRLVQLFRHPVSWFGLALAMAAGGVFLAFALLHLWGGTQNPYADLIVVLVVPALLAAAVLFVVLGALLQRRRDRIEGSSGPAWPIVDLSAPTTRRALLLVTGATFATLVALSLAGGRAIEYTESQEFCGQACHQVMGPYAVAHQAGLHSRVTCVQCHIEPGAQGFLKAKLNGTNQLRLLITNRYARPIPSPPKTATPNVYTSCEACHWSDRFIGDVIKVVHEYGNDAPNPETKTTLRLHVGGPIAGTGSGTGIHWHMNRSNIVEYIPRDDTLEEIVYVRVGTPSGGVREYFAEGVAPETLDRSRQRRMGCIDCHNRPAHRFGSTPERAIDAALGAGQISAAIPFIRREAVRALTAEYPDELRAATGIERSIREGITGSGAAIADDTALRQAIGVTQEIHRANVFPAMKIGWGTYADQTGHTTSAGCFRCHDESHAARDGRTIGQDCERCHAIE